MCEPVHFVAHAHRCVEYFDGILALLLIGLRHLETLFVPEETECVRVFVCAYAYCAGKRRGGGGGGPRGSQDVGV
jgi:hypothetical protein